MPGALTANGSGAVVRVVSDDTLLVYVSDTHIGGTGGTDIFESGPELRSLLDEINGHDGPVELILAGDFLDLLRMGDAGSGAEHVGATLHQPQYTELFAALRAFAQTPGHRVVYLMGNHDAEVWWNGEVQRLLVEDGVIDEFALSHAARFDSLSERLIYCEHGNQFDPSNMIIDHSDPLDTPLGAHIVTDLVGPIGAGAQVTRRVDLRDVSYVFPLAAIPQWIAGRIFYQLLGDVLKWMVAPLVVAFVLPALIVGVARADGSSAVASILLELGYYLAVLLLAVGALFFVSRKTAGRMISRLTTRFHDYARSAYLHGEAQIRDLLASGRAPPMAANIATSEIAVFVSGHTHSPAISDFDRADGSTTVIVNTGCWLRQLRPVTARLDAPAVFVPEYIQSHVRVRLTPDGLTVELWNHPKPADRRLPFLERAAVVGRMSSQKPPGAQPHLLATRVVSAGSSPGN